jgi:hypothetical protein
MMLFFFLDGQESLKGNDLVLKVSEIRKRISERVLKGRDERKNGVFECEERMSLVFLLCCEYLISKGEKRNEFMRDVVFPLSTSLLDISHSTPQSDKTDLFLSHLLCLLKHCYYNSIYRSLLCCEEGRFQFGRIMSVCNERVLDETRRMSLDLVQILFRWSGEREVEWMVKEGGVLGMIRRQGEKEERNRDVMEYACLAAAKFLRPWSRPIRRVRKEWKGTKEWREVMWMMEEEGEIDSLCGWAEAYGRSLPKQLLRELGICCSE